MHLYSLFYVYIIIFAVVKETTNKKNTKQIIRFILVGTLNAAIIALVIWLGDEIGCNYLWANVAGYIIALINNFFWSKYWVFSAGNGFYGRQAILFLLAFACAYSAQFLALLTMVEVAGWNEYISQFIGLFIYGAVNFLMNKKITFARADFTEI